jgi:hypothetical protein
MQDVTIVARDMPGDLRTDWASPWYVSIPMHFHTPYFTVASNQMNRAGAVFHPQTAATKSQQEMQKTSFKFYWNLAHKTRVVE